MHFKCKVRYSWYLEATSLVTLRLRSSDLRLSVLQSSGTTTLSCPAFSTFPEEQTITPNDLLPEALLNPTPQGMGWVFFRFLLRSWPRGFRGNAPVTSPSISAHLDRSIVRQSGAFPRNPKMANKQEESEKMSYWQSDNKDPPPICESDKNVKNI